MKRREVSVKYSNLIVFIRHYTPEIQGIVVLAPRQSQDLPTFQLHALSSPLLASDQERRLTGFPSESTFKQPKEQEGRRNSQPSWSSQ